MSQEDSMDETHVRTGVQSLRRAVLAVQHWSKEDWEDFWLALNRIASHSCEEHFGTTRSTVKRDPRADHFVAAEVTAALIHDISRALGIKPLIRRFREIAGCTLIPGTCGLIFVEFGDIMNRISALFAEFKHSGGIGYPEAWVRVIQPFLILNGCLGGGDPAQQVTRFGPMDGRPVQSLNFRLASSFSRETVTDVQPRSSAQFSANWRMSKRWIWNIQSDSPIDSAQCR